MSIEAFRVTVADEVLHDLQQRLQQTRWVEDFGNDDWRYGSNSAYLKELLEHWRDRYDWRAQEREINAFPQFRTEIDGIPIHFIHVRGKAPKGQTPKPLILSHGWPWSFWDYKKIIGPLSDPAAHGGDAADAFDVIVPSLPGYGFSTPLRKTGVNFWQTSGLWVKLMEKLGYPRFAAHGADWGALITADLGHRYADRIIGAHFTLMLPLDLLSGGTMPDPADYAPEEAALAQRTAAFFQSGSGYLAIQSTRPQTLSYALNDSPLGLLSWIVDKRRAWSDCNGDVETRFSKDDLITTVMLYWVTQSFGTSARYYYEAAHNPWQPAHARTPVVEAPVGLTVLPREVAFMPRKWAEGYYNLQQFRLHEAGGHFAAWEEPLAVIGDVRDFFRGRD